MPRSGTSPRLARGRADGTLVTDRRDADYPRAEVKLRRILLGFLVVWGVFATAAFRNCGRPAPAGREPTPTPSLTSADPAEVTQAYWLAARRVRARCAGTVITREELQRKADAIRSLADGKRVWAELARSYSQAATENTEGVKELKSLPAERVDPVAAGCVGDLADFLALQADLLQKTGGECGEMAALFAEIHAAGDAFDWDGPRGKESARREADLTARMKQTVANEGAAEKRRLGELAAKAKTVGAALARKQGRDFPDLLGN